jgi:hypothetical protein
MLKSFVLCDRQSTGQEDSKRNHYIKNIKTMFIGAKLFGTVLSWSVSSRQILSLFCSVVRRGALFS